jgi:hypothetical protein
VAPDDNDLWAYLATTPATEPAAPVPPAAEVADGADAWGTFVGTILAGPETVGAPTPAPAHERYSARAVPFRPQPVAPAWLWLAYVPAGLLVIVLAVGMADPNALLVAMTQPGQVGSQIAQLLGSFFRALLG